MRAELLGQLPGRALERGFGGGIIILPGRRLNGGERRDIDDRAAFLRLHRRQHRLDHAQRAEAGNIDAGEPGFDVVILERLVGGVLIRAVDQPIDPPESVERRLGQAAALLGVGDIGRHGDALTTGGADFVGHRLEKIGRARGQGDLGALGGRDCAELAPHTGTDAGDNHHLVAQQHVSSPCF